LAAPTSWWPREVWLQSDVELLPAEKKWLSNSRLHFDNPETAIFVPDALLSRRPKTSSAGKVSAFEREPISKEHDQVLRELLRTSLVAGESHLKDLEKSVGLRADERCSVGWPMQARRSRPFLTRCA